MGQASRGCSYSKKVPLGGGVGQASRGSALTAGKFPWGGGVGQTLLSPSAPRGKVVAGGSILMAVRDWKLCVETEILLWEKGRKEGGNISLLLT